MSGPLKYILVYSVERPDLLARNNQDAQSLGFGSERYWFWTVDAIAEICKKYNDDELVVKQFGLLFEWLEKQAEGVKA